jgi:hypothetical protein
MVNRCFYTNSINGIPSFLICKKFARKLRKSKKGEENKRKMDFSKSLTIRNKKKIKEKQRKLAA